MMLLYLSLLAVAKNCGTEQVLALSIVCMIAKVFKQGPWSRYDQELRRLVRALPQTVLASRADSTSWK